MLKYGRQKGCLGTLWNRPPSTSIESSDGSKEVGKKSVTKRLGVICALVLSLGAVTQPVSADSDFYSDSTSDVPSTAFPITSIGFGHGREKLLHYIYMGRSFRASDFESGSDYGVTLHISTDGTEFWERSRNVYYIGVVRDPGWFDGTSLIGEVFRTQGGFTTKRVPVYKVGNSLKVRIKPRVIGNPASYYFGVNSYGPGKKEECPDTYSPFSGCQDEVAFDLSFFHDL